ncbi:MAG: hypothetical protein CMM86_02515 [Rhodovulum sp.]|nr:hypothetical protein [Rhodovulum sp.]
MPGCPTARATWGDVCSPTRRISFVMKAGACMKPDFALFGVLCAPISPSSSDVLGMPRDFMEINRFLREES